MKIAYTIFHSDKLDDNIMNRKKNVKILDKKFSKIGKKYESEVIVIKTIKDYKNILKQQKELRSLKMFGKFRIGAIGLIFTTYCFYKKMLKEDFDILIILEDDSFIYKNSILNIIKYINQLPKDFDIFSMYDNPFFFKKYNSKNHDINKDDICISYNNFSTMGYAISKKGLIKYLEYMEKIINGPIDLFLFDDAKDTKKYAIKPSSQQVIFSDLLNNVGESIYNYSNISKTIEIKLNNY